MRLTAKTAPRDAGFTLIELLIVIVITSVVVVPLGDALIVYFRNTDATSAWMALSHDAQISAAYFAGDVAGLGRRDFATTGAGGTIPFQSSIQVDAAFDAGGQVCGTSATPAAKVRLLADDWDTSTTPATRGTRIVAYYLAAAGTASELHRLVCAGGTTTDIVVAHDVDDGDPAATPPRPSTVVVKCDGSTSPAACTGTSVPQTVELDFSVTSPGADAYPIALTGQRRQQ